jgi:hypothetical protein
VYCYWFNCRAAHSLYFLCSIIREPIFRRRKTAGIPVPYIKTLKSPLYCKLILLQPLSGPFNSCISHKLRCAALEPLPATHGLIRAFLRATLAPFASSLPRVFYVVIIPSPNDKTPEKPAPLYQLLQKSKSIYTVA